MKYEAVIGLEVHAQLTSASKIFCSCKTTFGALPNSQTCPICLGLPGVLPVLNQRVVEYAVKLGIATHSQINRTNVFARKNYFYPDLPKGYQISQFDRPICEHGYLEIEIQGETKRIGIIRIHMEEDAGKSVHDEAYVDANETLIDLNRCGVPLLEIVSAPDLHSAKEAHDYLLKLRQLLRYLEICDGNMEEGSLRCDANISVRPFNLGKLGVRTELKNMNSFRHVERALEFEIKRQIAILESGGIVEQQTLLWDPLHHEARPMRDKEESHDYRYFPEPDLLPVMISTTWLDEIEKSLPELPDFKIKRFLEQYHLPAYDVLIICSSKEMADYFEQVAVKCSDYKLISNWIIGEISRILNERKIEIQQLTVSPERLADLLNAIVAGKISSSAAKKVFDEAIKNTAAIEHIIEHLGLNQLSDSAELEEIIDDVLKNNPSEAELYQQGKTKVLGFLIGQIMKVTAGKANPGMVNTILLKKLKET